MKTLNGIMQRKMVPEMMQNSLFGHILCRSLLLQEYNKK